MKALYFYSGDVMAHLIIAKADDTLQFHTIENAPGHQDIIAYANISGAEVHELRDFLNENFPEKDYKTLFDSVMRLPVEGYENKKEPKADEKPGRKLEDQNALYCPACTIFYPNMDRFMEEKPDTWRCRSCRAMFDVYWEEMGPRFAREHTEER